MRRALHGIVGAILLATASGGSALALQDPLQPYQMVRSLQLVQDRIASGDQAAMPMQAKLLEMIDARFHDTTAEEFKDPKNVRALLIYGMSGGNPATIRDTVGGLDLDKQDKALFEGVYAYLNGHPDEAIKALAPVDPMTLPSELGAFVALVKGSLLSQQDPAQALGLLDAARLLSPGTLVEEAALRRSIGLAITTGDGARFALASTQYANRFLYSPYASQFADAFVSGAVALHMAIGQDKLADITAMMDPERERVIYLRIARLAAIDGIADLSTFAAARAERGRDGDDGRNDVRAQLYASLSTLTSPTIGAARASLKKIDRSKLSQSDRTLLDAAEAVTREVIAPPIPIAAEPSIPAAASSGDGGAGKSPADATAQPSKTAAASPDGADAAGLPPVEGIQSERPADASAPTQIARQEPAPLPETAASAPPATATGDDDPTDIAIADARRKLESVDQMLGDAPQ